MNVHSVVGNTQALKHSRQPVKGDCAQPLACAFVKPLLAHTDHYHLARICRALSASHYNSICLARLATLVAYIYKNMLDAPAKIAKLYSFLFEL